MPANPDQDEQGGDAGHDENGKCGPQHSGQGDDRSDQQRTSDGANLVERLMHREAAAQADSTGGVRLPLKVYVKSWNRGL